MTPERYQQVKQIFHHALELEPEERAAFLTEACAGDTGLRGEVESLFAAHREAGDFIEAPAASAITLSETEERDAPVSSRRIGPYQLLREIGRGGMGTVWLALRADDEYRKRVAIKLVRRGLAADHIIRRFRQERQILASLDHPNIARLLDGGTTEDGLPYFVMEYIEGQPIDEYCDQHRLSTVERLKLFREVCAAVQYAHQNLIVHRDIKPGNILLTSDGTPKLLDFGIAKLLNPELAASTPDPTLTAMQMMTPGYASPEQVRGQSVTTATDIYSLGIVLYELLTGHRPYHVSSLLPHEVARIICEQEPARPSTAVTRVEIITDRHGPVKTAITPEQVGRVRNEQPEKLRRRLSGDLDNIIMMALRKEPQRRYVSVSQFSEDIRHHLEGLPVLARDDTFSYRASKFIRRHRAGVAAAAFILIALLAGLAATLWQARVARAERARAERRFNDVRRLANSFMFELHDAIENLPGSTQARALLVRRALEYLDSLANESASDPTLQRELATAYEKVGDIQGNPYEANLGEAAGALQSYRKALAIREALAGTDSHSITARAELAACYARLGDVLGFTRKPADALEMYRKALGLREQLLAEQPGSLTLRHELSKSYEMTGDALRKTGDTAGALENFRRALALLEALVQQEPGDQKFRRGLAVLYHKTGGALARTGDTTGAMENARKGLALAEALVASDPLNARTKRDLALMYNEVGDLLWGLNDLKGALENYRRGLELREQLAAADPANIQLRRDVAISLSNVGYIEAQQGDDRSSIENYQKAQPIWESLLAASPNDAEARRDLAAHHAFFGDICKILAGRPKLSIRQQLEYWQSASTHYQQSLRLTLEMRDQGMLRGQDADQPDRLSREIARGEEAIARLKSGLRPVPEQ